MSLDFRPKQQNQGLACGQQPSRGNRGHRPRDSKDTDQGTAKTTTAEAKPMLINSVNSRSERRLVFTSSQAAVYLGVSLATIRRWTDAGHLGCYRTPGGQRRFSRDQLDGFIASMQQSGEEQANANGEAERTAARKR